MRTIRLLALLSSAALFVTLSLGTPSTLEAQDRKPKKKTKKKTKKTKKRAKKKSSQSRRAAQRSQSAPPHEGRKDGAKAEHGPGADQSAPAGDESSAAIDSEVVHEGDREVKVMSFSGLDVEGRLKSPQLLYFVNRVRAEFDRPGLPHRSFLPQLEDSTHGEALR